MTTTATSTTTWTIDPAHSVAEFSIKHMMISTVKGRFRTLAGRIELDEERPERSSVTATIDAASVDTGVEMRDNHLRSADFFEVETYPAITFHSTKVEHAGGDEWRITGDLTLHGVTREITLRTEYDGQIRDAFGKQRAAFTARTQINRKDYGLNWNGLIESGGVVAGERVNIELRIAATLDE